VTVHVVNPGVIDTELFHLPDNEPSLSDLQPERAEDLAAAMLHQLEEGTFELYFPAWFHDVAVSKVSDPDAFFAGSQAWVAQREVELGLR
jgi:short-subunit dehydrogenase